MFQPTKAVAWVKAKFSPGIKIKKDDSAELQKLLWTEVEASLRIYFKALIEELLKTELAAHLQASRYERSDERKDYRNGAYERTLATRFGEVGDLQVPRTRHNTYATKLFDQYARRAKSVDEAIGTLFLNGSPPGNWNASPKNSSGQTYPMPPSAALPAKSPPKIALSSRKKH